MSTREDIYARLAEEVANRNLGYREGLRAGRLDRSLGIRLSYSSVCFETESRYQQDYTRGYNDGQCERSNDAQSH